jgi:NAD+ synthase (glutamine-hydrolysing)
MAATIGVWSGALNQQPMAFARNLNNILASLSFCQENKLSYRPGVELEVCGHSCGDHLKEKDTHEQIWNSVSDILTSGLTKGLLVELGLPVLHKGKLYSCLIVIHNEKVLYIRPKTHTSNSSLFNEGKYFESFDPTQSSDVFILPENIQNITGQKEIGFGRYFVKLQNFSAVQLFRSEFNQKIAKQALRAGVNVISISSAGFFESGSIATFSEELKVLSNQSGSNIIVNSLSGSEGCKLIFEGGSFWALSQEVKLISENLGLAEIENHQIWTHKTEQTMKSYPGPQSFKALKVNSSLDEQNNAINFSDKHDFVALEYERELLNAMSSYIWDQLLKSSACGFFVPLSGGADSSLISFTVHYLCKRVVKSKDKSIKDLFKKVTGNQLLEFESAENLTKEILFTAYLPSSFSGVTKKFAENLAARIHANFMIINIQKIFDQFKDTIESALEIKTSFRDNGKFEREDLALQNLQARIRLVLSYLCAQLLPVKFNLRSFLLCFGTGNLSEVLRGYYTKYDCSSGDLNIIGSLNKTDIKKILLYASKEFEHFEVLEGIAQQAPTAELRPGVNGTSEQTDEGEMGFTYEELDFLGLKMKLENMGYDELVYAFGKAFPDQNANEKIEKFLLHFRRNRHKSTILPMSVHLTNYDTDGAFDTRPVLYIDEPRLGKRENLEENQTNRHFKD